MNTILPLNKLYPMISQAERSGLFFELQKIYNSLPETTCQRCGNCCIKPPPAYIIEYLHMYRYLQKNLKPQWPLLAKKLLEFYFLELADVNLKCPFLGEENLCLIYPVRSLTCRLYGLNNEAIYWNRAGMEELAKSYLEEYDIKLPDEVISFQPRVCSHDNPENGMSAEMIQLAIDNVARLESILFPAQLVEGEYTFIPLSHHLASTILSKGARLRRPKVIKEYLESGTTRLLDSFIKKAQAVEL